MLNSDAGPLFIHAAGMNPSSELWERRRPRLLHFGSECIKKKRAFADRSDTRGTLLKLAYPQWFLSLSNANAIFLWTCGGPLEGGMWLSGGRDSAAFNLRLKSSFSSYPCTVCSGGSAQITELFRVAAVSVRQEADATVLCNKAFVVRSLWLLKAHPLQAAASLIAFPVRNAVCFLHGPFLSWFVLPFSLQCVIVKQAKKVHDLAGLSLYPDITGAKKKKNNGLTCSEEVRSSTDIWADKHVSSMRRSEVKKTVSEGISERCSVKQRVQNGTDISFETYFQEFTRTARLQP